MTANDHTPEPMYCPACDEMVPQKWDRYDEAFCCPRCDSRTYESKEEYISVLHATARFNKEHGYGPWWDDSATAPKSEGGQS